ncbi:MAG: orotidine-5'-phosphate decarboxylase [Planctomycetes bacterium]|nr:orotidine-5'-phosphate decarboxylase [Planctomycetota bacterium]
MTPFGERLARAVEAKGSAACVGLDPLLDQLPEAIREACDVRHESLESVVEAGGDPEAWSIRAAEALAVFGEEVLRIVAPLVAVVKINIAFFERYFAPGLRAYHRVAARARDLGLVVIGDVKRADIGHTSLQYAEAQLGRFAGGAGRSRPLTQVDAVTVNPYFGYDGIKPFVDVARRTGGGLFVLVQTSNATAQQVQGLKLSDGSTVCHAVARLVQQWAEGGGLSGERGYSSIGAVVSPTDGRSTRRLRELMPSCLFLVPGFGAQGRTADEVADCFKPDGTGAVITASRSVIFAYRQDKSADWRSAVDRACREFVTQIAAVAQRRPGAPHAG